ncbi:uncharacterized protein LOC142368743 [Odontesthes bonariensis]|uniref:uncharacterized protein LOC142368743 n=1 Tax=Odontesthes bonariensis TaxID=219752 RepID=UPI003F58C3E2
MYKGESVTIRCEIHGDVEWEYEWTTTSSYKPPKQNEYRIHSVHSYHSGNYRCKGRMRSATLNTTEWSAQVTLTVSGKEAPLPVLAVSPSWVSPGASVTLSCQVKHLSAGWSFYWYRAVPDMISHAQRPYNVKPLPHISSATAQGSHVIPGGTHTAGYVCRAGRGDPVYFTDYSELTFVWSSDFHSAASLTVAPNSVQHHISDTVSLNCEGNSERRLSRFNHIGYLSHYYCTGTGTGSTCNMNSQWPQNSVYWCESGSGDFSNAVNITAQDTDVILVSPVLPVTVGASVGLSCRLRVRNNLSGVFFYHNDKLVQNDSSGQLDISAVSQSDEGFYKCEHSGKVSPQSWMSVKAHRRAKGETFFF